MDRISDHWIKNKARRRITESERERDGEAGASAEHKVDSHSGEHMDPVQRRRILHLLHLLCRAQIEPRLQPINAWHCFCLQGHWCQCWGHIGPPLLLRHTQDFPSALRGSRCWCDTVLPRLFSHVGLRRWTDRQASSGVDVPLHVSCSSCSDLFQHRRCCQWLRKLSSLWWYHRWYYEGMCDFCSLIYFSFIHWIKNGDFIAKCVTTQFAGDPDFFSFFVSYWSGMGDY